MLQVKCPAVNGGSCCQNREVVQSAGIADPRTDEELADNAAVARDFGDSRLGQHFLYELYACHNLPRSAERLQRHMVRAAELTGATVVNATFHEFSPHGLSGVVILAESHLAVHTWPEYDCACVDLFSCCPTIVPEPGIEYLRDVFSAGRVDVNALPRGMHANRLSADEEPSE